MVHSVEGIKGHAGPADGLALRALLGVEMISRRIPTIGIETALTIASEGRAGPVALSQRGPLLLLADAGALFHERRSLASLREGLEKRSAGQPGCRRSGR